MFTTVKLSIHTGLVASAVASSWTIAATLLTLTTWTYLYGISGAYFYDSGPTVQIFVFAIAPIEQERRDRFVSVKCDIRLKYSELGTATFSLGKWLDGTIDSLRQFPEKRALNSPSTCKIISCFVNCAFLCIGVYLVHQDYLRLWNWADKREYQSLAWEKEGQDTSIKRNEERDKTAEEIDRKLQRSDLDDEKRNWLRGARQIEKELEDVWTLYLAPSQSELSNRSSKSLLTNLNIKLHAIPGNASRPDTYANGIKCQTKRDIWLCLDRRSEEDWNRVRDECLHNEGVDCQMMDGLGTFRVDVKLRRLDEDKETRDERKETFFFKKLIFPSISVLIGGKQKKSEKGVELWDRQIGTALKTHQLSTTAMPMGRLEKRCGKFFARWHRMTRQHFIMQKLHWKRQ
ncbi:uncharacterized protein BDR25DRAFT_375340 [Lindgomyces ingoldianus]|uniref:Uncharacterized protein n=1 Tax=Lindgomyces ingoldianus TaxID=673940 RepID=A0ACB6RDK2_9PLEO|nr:uncharacterized protein BDR25DRAFT_375340 [Lindgomyces ingoldianus]KAF2476407.1 hypothetical protein BDR25DRAFT_375340 [Lindgomyces ingoldianus]